jgi:2,3-dihydroxyphenylpropionate 1,2-dioxygenase
MAVQLICTSHSPLIEFASPREQRQEWVVRNTFSQLADKVKAFDPTLIIAFGPDHFNGFFYDLMPSFCVGVRATAAGDWNYGPEVIQVPEARALQLIRSVLEQDIDIAYSYRMQADHGITQPLHFLCEGQLNRYPTIPIFINSAAVPLPSMRRSIALGQAIGRFVGSLDLNQERVLILGTGGLSHDPPTPQIGSVTADVEEFLIAGRNPSIESRQQRQAKVLAVGQKLAAGDASLSMPLNPNWDKRLLSLFQTADFERFADMSEEQIRQQGGRGGQEIRCWVAAFAALQSLGDYRMDVHCYEEISEWIAGFSMVSAQLKAG